MRPIEDEILRCAEQVIKDKFGNLELIGVRVFGPRVKGSIIPDLGYQSELQVDFYHGGELIDSLECFIFRKDSLEVSVSQIQAWLISNIEDICQARNP